VKIENETNDKEELEDGEIELPANFHLPYLATCFGGEI
jgi:hypothetical protein